MRGCSLHLSCWFKLPSVAHVPRSSDVMLMYYGCMCFNDVMLIPSWMYGDVLFMRCVNILCFNVLFVEDNALYVTCNIECLRSEIAVVLVVLLSETNSVF